MVKRKNLGFLEKMLDLVCPLSEEGVKKEVTKKLMKWEEPEKIAGYILIKGYQKSAIDWLQEFRWTNGEFEVIRLLDKTKAGELALARGNYQQAAQIFFETGNREKCQQATAQGTAILKKEGMYGELVKFLDCIGESWQAYETGLKGLEETTFRAYQCAPFKKEVLVLSFEEACSKVNLTESQRKYARTLVEQARRIIKEELAKEEEAERTQSEPDDPETEKLREYYKCI